MFDLNFIAEPGIQIKASNESWSFLHKRKIPDTGSGADKTPSQSSKPSISWKAYGLAIALLLTFYAVGIISSQHTRFDSNMVLNQVIDLIVESGYMQELQLSDAHFTPHHVQVTIRSENLTSLQEFTQGYRKEDKIPYQMYHREGLNFVSLHFPWEGNKKGGNIKSLSNLAGKTVFSNKISINTTGNKFELQGRSSDIISYLLQMADDAIIQKFTFSVHHLESGRYNLKVQMDQS